MFPATTWPRICHRPLAPDGLNARGLPPDSASAMAEATCAVPAPGPPAPVHRPSRYRSPARPRPPGNVCPPAPACAARMPASVARATAFSNASSVALSSFRSHRVSPGTDPENDPATPPAANPGTPIALNSGASAAARLRFRAAVTAGTAAGDTRAGRTAGRVDVPVTARLDDHPLPDRRPDLR